VNITEQLGLIQMHLAWLEASFFQETFESQPKDWEALCKELARLAPSHNLPIGVFKLERETDVTGVSGTGTVAYGIEFGSTGGVLIGWLGKYQTITHHQSRESVETIHCHNGASKVVWL
jgi:hypothetical protein